MKPSLPSLARAGALLLATALTALAAAPAHDIYAAVAMTKAQKNSPTPTDSGLYVRRAGGNGDWALYGPRVLGITSIADQPGTEGKVLLLSCADGVLRSTDAGATWRKTTSWDVADVRCIDFAPSHPATAYAATCWGPLRSTDGGATWELAQRGLPKLYCQTLSPDPADPRRVLLGTEAGIYVSTDGAKSWSATRGPAVCTLKLARGITNPHTLIATTLGHGALLSHDNGATWSPTDPGSASANLYAAAIDPADTNRLAVGGWGVGVRVSADGGKTWTDRTAGLPAKNVFVVAFDPDVKGRLWVSTFEEGTRYSDDLGATWQDGGLYGAYAFDFVFLPAARTP